MNTNGFQTVVKAKQAFGIPGEFRDSSVKRVLPYELGATANIGNPAYLIAASGKVTDKFATGTAGTSVDGRQLGTFIDDATAGEPVGVSVMEAI